MCHGIIFDLDGTLVDSLADLADSVNRILAREGLPSHGYDRYKIMIGNGLRVLIERAVPDSARDPLTVERIKKAVEKEYEEHCLDLTRPYPGIPELLEELRRRKIRMAVLSNKPDAFTARIVAALFPGSGFDPVQGQRPAVPNKPDPESALAVARGWMLEPRELAFLGDSEVDMETAVAAGIPALGAAWGFRSREELADAGAGVLLGHPSEVLDWLRT